MHTGFSEEGLGGGFPTKTTSVYQKQDMVMMEDAVQAACLPTLNALHPLVPTNKFAFARMMGLFLSSGEIKLNLEIQNLLNLVVYFTANPVVQSARLP